MSRFGFSDLIWQPAADGASYNTSTTLTDVTPAPQFTFGTNYGLPQLGQTFHVDCWLHYSTTSAPTLIVGLYYGGVAGVALCATGAVVMGSTQTGLGLHFEADVEFTLLGTSGTAKAQGKLSYGLTTVTGGVAMAPTTTPANVTVDTTVAKALTIGAQWGTNSASNIVIAHQFDITARN